MKKTFFAVLILFFINLVFFYPVWLKGQVPFPGDLLLAEYNPWRSYSYFGYNPGAIPNKAQSFDTLRQLYPWRYLAIQMMKKGKWPLWNPYNFSGTPLLANFQTAPFYPLNFLYFLLNFNLAWTLQVVIQPFLSSLFTYLFLRRLKVSFGGAILGGISFGYSSFMTVWLEYNTIGHVILWLPLSLLAVELLLEKISFFRASILIGGLTFSFLAGHPQDFALLWLFVQVYLLTRIIIKKRRKSFLWGKVFIISLAPFFLGAIQLFPGIELILNSARSPLNYEFLMKKVLLQPWQLIFAFIPDFFGNPATRNYFLDDTYIGKVLYVGLVTAIFSLSAVFIKKNFWLKFFLAATVVTLFLTVASPISSFLYSLPIFSGLFSTRLLFLFQFSLAILAGFGFDGFGILKLRKKLFVLGWVGLIFLLVWTFVLGRFSFLSPAFLANLGVVRRNLIYSTGLFLIATLLLFLVHLLRRSKKAMMILGLVIVLFLGADLFRFFSKITPFSPVAFIFPPAEIFDFLKQKGRGRFWGYGTAAIEPNYNLIYNLYSIEGYDPLYPRWYGEFIRLSEEGKFKPAVRSDAMIASGFGRTDFAENKYRQRVLEVLSVRYILDRIENQTDETTFPPAEFPLIWQSQGWRIYKNQKAAPQAFMASKIHFAKDPSDFEKIFFSPDFLPANQVILAEKIGKVDSAAQGEVVIKEYQPTLIRISATAPQAQILVVTDNYYPGWKAFIDGQEVPIYRANHSFRAVWIPSGKHQVKFVYFPFSFRMGFLVSLVSLGGWLLLGGFTIISKRP